MSLILAIEPDHRQAAQLADLIRGRLKADLVHAHTTEGALVALAGIGDRVPDLVLVPSLLSAQEDAAIAGALRVIAAAANVRMLTIPMLADPEQPAQHRGVFAKLRGRKTQTTPGGCDPAVFAEQIASYLAEAAAERRAAQEAAADLVAPAAIPAAPVAAPAAPVAAPPVAVTPRAAAPTVEEIRAPGIEPVPEAPTETVSIRFAPLVIGPAPRPASNFDRHVSVVRKAPAQADTPLVLSEPSGATNSEEPRSIWLPAPAAPVVEPAPADREQLAEAMFVEEMTEVPQAIEEPVPPAAIAAEQTLAVAHPAAIEEETLPIAEVEETWATSIISEPIASAKQVADAPPSNAIDETFDHTIGHTFDNTTDNVPQVLPVIASEELSRSAAEDASQVLAIEEVLQALALEEAEPAGLVDAPAPRVAAVDDAPVVVAIPEEPSVPEPSTEAKPVNERARGARRRRKARRAAAESDDRFDIDALLAPLLSEIAAKRSAPTKVEPSVLAATTDHTPNIAAPIEVSAAPVIIEPPAMPIAEVETTEPVAAPGLAIEPVVQTEPTDRPPLEQIAAVFAPIEPPSIAPTPIELTANELTPTALTATEFAAAELPPTELPPTEWAAPEFAATTYTATEWAGTESAQVEATLDVPTPIASAAVVPAPVERTTIELEPIEAAPLQVSWVEPPPVVPTPIEAAPAAAITTDYAPLAMGGAAEGDIDPMFFADDVHEGVSDPSPNDRPAWVELIESLRKDIERLKADRAQPAEAAAPATVSTVVSEPQAPPRLGRVLSIAAARPANPPPVAPAEKLSTLTPRAKAPKPVQDQWGLFDPEQCGFAALRAKLDEISSREEVSV